MHACGGERGEFRLTGFGGLVVAKALPQGLDPIVACPSEFASADRHEKEYKGPVKEKEIGVRGCEREGDGGKYVKVEEVEFRLKVEEEGEGEGEGASERERDLPALSQPESSWSH